MVNHVTMSIKFKVIALKEHLLDFLSRPLHKRLALEEGLLDKYMGASATSDASRVKIEHR